MLTRKMQPSCSMNSGQNRRPYPMACFQLPTQTIQESTSMPAPPFHSPNSGMSSAKLPSGRVTWIAPESRECGLTLELSCEAPKFTGLRQLQLLVGPHRDSTHYGPVSDA